MGAPATKLPLGSARRIFFTRLLTLKESPAEIQLQSVALGMGVHPSLLTRYLKEATSAGWVVSRRTLTGVEITVLDRAALERAADGTGEAVRGQASAQEENRP